MNEKTKKILKTAGKVGLTALVPPLGLPTFFRGDKKPIAMIGAILSMFSTAFISGRYEDSNQIYDSPNVYVEVSPGGFFSVASAFTSPLTFLLVSSKQTNLDSSMGRFYVEGHDVITFDKATSKYVLNFDVDRQFEQYDKNISRIFAGSVKEKQERVSVLTSQLEELTSQGDVFGARRISEERGVAIREYDAAHQAYTQTKQAYDGVVQKMNDELMELKEKQGNFPVNPEKKDN